MGLSIELVTWGASFDLTKALQELKYGIHAEALALCSLLLESGGINLNHADVA